MSSHRTASLTAARLALVGIVLALAGLLGCAAEPAKVSPETAKRVRELISEAIQVNQRAMDRVEQARHEPVVPPEAVALLRDAERLAGDDPTLLPELAQAFYYMKEIDTAIRLLRQVTDSGALAKGSMELRVVQEMLGRIHLDRGELREAEAFLTAAAEGLVELHERDPSLYYGCPYQALGKLYSETNRTDESIQAFYHAADLEFTAPGPQFEAAQAAVDGGDLDTAAAYLRRGLALSSAGFRWRQFSSWIVSVREARRKVRAGQPKTPPLLVVYYAAAIELRQWLYPASRPVLPHPPAAYGGEEGEDPDDDGDGSLADRRRRSARVEVVCRLLVEDFVENDFGVVSRVADVLLAIPPPELDIPDRDGLRALHGYVLLVRQAYDDAHEVFDALARSESGAAQAAVGLGHLAIVRQEYRRAEELLRPAVTKGDALWTGGGRAKAAAETGSFAWLHYRMAALGLAWAAANQNRNEQALAYYDRILTHTPDDTFALLGKGNSLSALLRLDEADAVLRRVLARDARNPFALAELGLVHYNRGDHQKAEDAFARALEQDDEKYTCPYEGLGLVYLRQGRTDEARRHFEKAIRIDPDIEYKKYNGLARIYIAEGRHDEARRLLLKSIENYPYDDEARRLLKTLPPAAEGPPAP